MRMSGNTVTGAERDIAARTTAGPVAVEEKK
jgi:hypothetical protein